MSIQLRNNVRVFGDRSKPVLFYAHGFGCHQGVWTPVYLNFEQDYCQILFDYVGCGGSDLSQYNFSRYSKLDGYAQDIIEILDELALSQDIILVGHSVSCSIGALVAKQRPELFKAMILLGPSPCFLNVSADYQGGFEQAQLDELIAMMDADLLRWANYMVPVVVGDAEESEASSILTESFCSTDPLVLQNFAKATFFADNRHDFSAIKVPTLILQHEKDNLAAVEIGQFVQRQIPMSRLEILNVSGHTAHMTHPELVIAHMRQFLKQNQL